MLHYLYNKEVQASLSFIRGHPDFVVHKEDIGA